MSMNKSYEGITAQLVQFTQVTYEKFKIQGDVISCISNAFLGGKGLQRQSNFAVGPFLY